MEIYKLPELHGEYSLDYCTKCKDDSYVFSYNGIDGYYNDYKLTIRGKEYLVGRPQTRKSLNAFTKDDLPMLIAISRGLPVSAFPFKPESDSIECLSIPGNLLVQIGSALLKSNEDAKMFTFNNRVFYIDKTPVHINDVCTLYEDVDYMYKYEVIASETKYTPIVVSNKLLFGIKAEYLKDVIPYLPLDGDSLYINLYHSITCIDDVLSDSGEISKVQLNKIVKYDEGEDIDDIPFLYYEIEKIKLSDMPKKGGVQMTNRFELDYVRKVDNNLAIFSYKGIEGSWDNKADRIKYGDRIYQYHRAEVLDEAPDSDFFIKEDMDLLIAINEEFHISLFPFKSESGNKFYLTLHTHWLMHQGLAMLSKSKDSKFFRLDGSKLFIDNEEVDYLAQCDFIPSSDGGLTYGVPYSNKETMRIILWNQINVGCRDSYIKEILEYLPLKDISGWFVLSQSTSEIDTRDYLFYDTKLSEVPINRVLKYETKPGEFNLHIVYRIEKLK